MPIIFTQPAGPTIGWEAVTTTGNPFTPTQFYNAKMWLYPDNNTLLVAARSTSSSPSREVASLNLTTMAWSALQNPLPHNGKLGHAVWHPVSGNPLIMGVSDQSRSVYEYIIGTDTWTKTQPFLPPRTFQGAAATNLPNGDVILLGPNQPALQYNDAVSWDGTTLTVLTDIPTSPVAVSGNSNLFASGTKVYMIGNRLVAGAVATDVVYRYDTNLNSWDSSITMPEPHQQCVVVPLDSTRAMVIGGSTGGGGSSNEKTYIFDASTETFTPYGVDYAEPAASSSASITSSQGIKLDDGRVLMLHSGTVVEGYVTINPV